MSFIKYYFITDEQRRKIPPSHNLDGLTRLQIKLARLDQVARVQPPRLNDFRIDSGSNDFIWCFQIERRFNKSWGEVDRAVAKALSEFMQTCAVS